MRALLILPVLAAIAFATPAAAQTGCTPQPTLASQIANDAPIIAEDNRREATPQPAILADLAADSPWRTRFEAAANDLLPALQSGDPGQWQPLLGGRWLAASDRAAVAAMLADRCGTFHALTEKRQAPARRILGWTIPTAYSDSDRADIAARPEAEALVCWSAENIWPRTAAEADNRPGRRYGCARIVYSLRGATPGWRAFVETPGYPAR